ncbi:divalent-cation tolerance protein CutA [uncultured Ferrovibrio sp.]|jgi:periplasmic divalent cation tolerance protein|uniref:divalent-cation tolerance protein CutA n=1 Tax=uncultured Ferrovibrio sp. TaxID=1576913 RepID=UPI0026191826|nr:divalent-cation tolerance protein CutA [uncultured Ferrovibrio sp.]
MSEIVLLYCTAASVAEAEKIAEAVVGQRLAACANIIPGMRSVYWWQGKLEKGEEAVLILKTRRDLVPQVTEAVKQAHSYAVPCVLPLPVGEGGNPDYVNWLLAETSAKSR